jgi:hypothetical protein
MFPSRIQVAATTLRRSSGQSRIIVGEAGDKLAQPMGPNRGNVESLEHVTLPPRHTL